MKKEFRTRYAQVAAGQLKIDHSYQRRVDRTFVRRKAVDFNPDAFGVLHVSLRADGCYYVIDGQHRMEIVLSLGEDWKRQNVPCLVYDGMTVAEEAAMFGELNTVNPMHAYDRFRADLTALEPGALAINATAKKNGFSIGPGSGAFSCVTALRRIYGGLRARNRAAGPENLDRTLRVLAKAFGTKAPHPHGSLVLGLGTFLERYAEEVDDTRVIHKLAASSGGWAGLVGRARGLREIEGGSIALAVFEVIRKSYNQGIRVNKLNSLRGEEEKTAA